MNDERDVQSLGEDIQSMVVSYTSFIEGIALQDNDLAWDLANKYADRLRDMIREVFADLTEDASKGLRNPTKKRRRRKKAEKAVASSVAETTTSTNMPMGAEELPANPDSLLSQINDPEQVDLALEQSMRKQSITTRAEDNREPPSRFNRNNPTMKRIDPNEG